MNFGKNKSVKKETEEAKFIWQEREIRFDIAMSCLAMWAGE